MRITRLAHRIVRLAIAAVAIAASTAVSAQQAATYEVVSSFDIAFFNGRAPSSLRQADDGTFYGTTSFGGVFDKGTLFRMDTTGVVTSLHSFSGPLDGVRPFGLVRASDGRFYGMTDGRRRVRIRNGVQIRSGRCGDDAACILGDRQQVPCGSVSGERWQRLRADGGRRRFRQRHDLRDRSGRQLHHHSQHSAQCRQAHVQPRQGERRPVLRHRSKGVPATAESLWNASSRLMTPGRQRSSTVSAASPMETVRGR